MEKVPWSEKSDPQKRSAPRLKKGREKEKRDTGPRKEVQENTERGTRTHNSLLGLGEMEGSLKKSSSDHAEEKSEDDVGTDFRRSRRGPRIRGTPTTEEWNLGKNFVKTQDLKRGVGSRRSRSYHL